MNIERNTPQDELTLPGEVQALFACYREAAPDREPTADFTPGLWNKIEARRGFTYNFGRLARRFVTAAAAICLIMSVGLIDPATSTSATFMSYIDVLVQDISDEADEIQLAQSETL
jgi:hypothetical protein